MKSINKISLYGFGAVETHQNLVDPVLVNIEPQVELVASTVSEVFLIENESETTPSPAKQSKTTRFQTSKKCVQSDSAPIVFTVKFGLTMEELKLANSHSTSAMEKAGRQVSITATAKEAFLKIIRR